MKIQLISDTHLRTENSFSVLNVGADVLIIAGDLAASPKIASQWLAEFRRQTDMPVVYVLGNHEYYGLNLYTGLDIYRQAVSKIEDVHLLEKEHVEIEGINFLGATLWSDLSDPMAALTVQNALNDYEFIEKTPGEHIQPSDTHAQYLLAVNWLKEQLAEHRAEKNVVVTHHAPCWACRNTYFDYDVSNRLATHGFCNRLDTLMYKHDVSLWLYGHTHVSKCFTTNGTRVISNQVGYESEKKHSSFDRRQLIEI